MDAERLRQAVRGKRVIYITTHRIEYLRVVQELNIIKEEAASVKTLYTDAGNHVKSALSIFRRLRKIKKDEYDVIFVSYMCQMIAPFIAGKAKGKTLIVDFFISLYDSLVFDRKKVKDGSLAAKFVHKLDSNSLKRADLVIADTRAHADYFSDEFGYKRENIDVLYLEADSTIYYPMEVPKDPEYKDKYLVLYFGTVIPLQGFEVVIEAARQLADHKNIHFLLIGPVAKHFKVFESDTVTYVDWMKQEDLARSIAMSDLCLSGHFNGEIEKANRTIPGKAYIYEAMEKKMILGMSDANRELFTEDERHIFVERGNAHVLARKILELASAEGFNC